MNIKSICLIVPILATVLSCTELNSGDSFSQVIEGVEYNFEVIVSKMAYVRIKPTATNQTVSGAVSLPSIVEYDGIKYAVTQIASKAFQGNINITSVTLPKTLSIIESEAFAGCTALREINTPQPLSTIEDYAFDGCASLQAFSLNASISKLGKGAFRGCTSLKGLNFTSTFTEIPDELCSGCTSLTEIDLPSTIMAIGNNAFSGCYSVKSIQMDRSVNKILNDAFAGCTSVESITCMTATPPNCGNNSFDGIVPTIPVTVPMASVSSYAQAVGWNHFVNFTGKY